MLAAWHGLPRRLYFDTSTLQTIYEFGGVLADGEDFEPDVRQRGVRGLAEEIEALRVILAVNSRAQFEIVVTEAALREVSERSHARYAAWVTDVMDTWLARSACQAPAQPEDALRHRRFGMISAKDRLLLQDALDLRCDAFITMERRLPATAAFVRSQTGLQVLRPTAYWELLRPWAALYL